MSDFNNYGFYDSGYNQQYSADQQQQQSQNQYGYSDQQQFNGGYGQPQEYGQQDPAYDWNSGNFQPQTFDQDFQQQAQQPYVPTLMTPDYSYKPTPPASSSTGAPGFTNYDDEPPLLEELGINFEHIGQKTLSVLNPWQATDTQVLDDQDLAGPLVFCLAFGGFLLLSGKVHGFGYIYGVGVMGCIALYAVLNLMSVTGVTLTCVVSVLGYCILPMVMLSALAVVFNLSGLLGSILTFIVIIWCAVSASKLFVTSLAMDSQQPLVAYPCALLYGVFALLTIF